MRIDIAKARARTGSRYPKPFDEPCQSKTRRQLGDAERTGRVRHDGLLALHRGRRRGHDDIGQRLLARSVDDFPRQDSGADLGTGNAGETEDRQREERRHVPEL